MFNLITNLEKYQNELRDIIKMFVPYFLHQVDITALINKEENQFCVEVFCGNDKKIYNFDIKEEGKSIAFDDIKALLVFYKIALYKALSQYYDVTLPWGSLTGVRPTKIIYKMLTQNKTLAQAFDVYEQKYLVSPEKSKLIKEIVANQNGIVYYDSSKVNLYIHIPFCPTKCKYCSFITMAAPKRGELIEEYLDCLIKEIVETKNIIKAKGQSILSVYIGGGTPTVLSADQLDRLLKAIDIKDTEYTVEAGRPDTITHPKLNVLKQNGVNRICINPQTFVDKTLLSIGRNHKSSQIYDAYYQANDFGFDINMDLIAGLPQETIQDFIYTLDCTIKLNPANITIHSLSFKNGSEYVSDSLDKDGKVPNQRFGFNPFSENMIQYAHGHLKNAGYLPYYIYRQKNMSGNLENTGYCLLDKQSVNNITVMEESVSVYACGAGAISKIIDNGQIKRHANLRDVLLYIDEFKQRLLIKNEFLMGFE